MVVDRTQFEQVILNLVVNAIDAMTAAGGRERVLVVRSERDARGWVAFSVGDTGIGLSAAQQERLFEPFFSCAVGSVWTARLAPPVHRARDITGYRTASLVRKAGMPFGPRGTWTRRRRSGWEWLGD